jgi:sugar O-acyltransferase (sialic acid O-acetyltransferase NeuD family)
VTPSQQPLIVVGASGFGREVAWLARECGHTRLLGWLDDADAMAGKTLCELPVLGKIAEWTRFAEARFVVAIGSPRARRRVVQAMQAAGEPAFATLIHPAVRKSQYVEIAEGSMITAGCILTTQVRLGRHTILNLGVTVGHDCVFGDYCTVAPVVPVSGNVTLGDGVEIGTGASIRQGIHMGAGSMAGMGAVVVKDVAANQLVVGSPARPLKDLPAWT